MPADLVNSNELPGLVTDNKLFDHYPACTYELKRIHTGRKGISLEINGFPRHTRLVIN